MTNWTISSIKFVFKGSAHLPKKYCQKKTICIKILDIFFLRESLKKGQKTMGR